MGPNVVRLTALASAALVLVLQQSINRWVHQPAWETEPLTVIIAVRIAWLLVSFAIPIGLYVLTAVLVWRRSLRTFWVDERRDRFVARALHRQMGWGFFVTWSTAGIITPSTGEPPYPPAVSLGFATTAVAIAAVILLLDRPRIVLTPAGLTVQGLRDRTFHAWDELEYLEPAAPVKKAKLVSLRVRHATTQQFVHVPADTLDSDMSFLIVALRRYAEQSGHRSAIGTREELARLCEVYKGQTAPI